MRAPTHATDVVTLGVLWQRLTGLMDEVAQAFVRTSFSAVVRENWDLAVSLMDAQGRQFAQSSRSIPSFLGTMPRTLRAMLARIPAQSLKPGDVLISNDPWLGTGHLNDITLARPIFLDGRLIAFVGGTFHCVDVGGAPRPDARDVYEEGLTIPICRIVKAGVEDREIVGFLVENFREPDEAMGDIRAMFAAFGVAERRLLCILDQERVVELGPIVDAILARSEASMRAALAAAPDGVVEDETVADGFEARLPIRCRIEKRGDGIALDFAGTAPQVPHPVNSPFGFSSAYAAYAVKCAFNPRAPNNDGGLRPITISAPEGCLVNPRRPAPVWGRHLSGHYLPFVVLGALAKLVPERVAAEAGAPAWNVYFRGEDRTGRRFAKMYFMSGGHGARAASDGPSVLSFPTNVANTPAEQFENDVPLLVTERRLIPDSGGAGRQRGGLGQRIAFRNIGMAPVRFMYRHERVLHPPRGLLGGEPGACGRELLDGKPIPAKTAGSLDPGSTLAFETPGGGGFGPPSERQQADHEADLVEGLITGAGRPA
ncbi:hydantoinase B/oxoprolinase family protein [Elioraea tepidiphila]|uniref:hydantoinase B/oxoprolinase family protein n=1 Tax=Elioraea tepidiphila TaxID=457934 RepID=UPI00036E978D|nr:hydantoinase B/oxoprolinase family protein [Elioraea tepidiphila]